MEENQTVIISGTGHRPQFCPCKFDEKHEWLLKLKLDIATELQARAATAVISGAAIGFDTWLAEAALSLDIPLYMYVPFRGQGSNWPESSRIRYQNLLKKAKIVKYISEDYSKDCFFKRDRAMIDDCDMVFSLLNPASTSGGTYYTVRYAESKGKVIHNLWY